MDWISGIQRAIDYIEAHLCEKFIEQITQSALARLLLIFCASCACIICSSKRDDNKRTRFRVGSFLRQDARSA
jgi:hypothetical protein